jgi:hypothetical protein
MLYERSALPCQANQLAKIGRRAALEAELRKTYLAGSAAQRERLGVRRRAPCAANQ